MVTRKLLGHVDNRAYTTIKVDIQLTLTTPENAPRRVPVIMEFGFVFPTRHGAPPPAGSDGPTWQEQVIAKGWGYAVLSPTSVQADNGAGLREGIIGLVNKGEPRMGRASRVGVGGETRPRLSPNR